MVVINGVNNISRIYQINFCYLFGERWNLAVDSGE